MYPVPLTGEKTVYQYLKYRSTSCNNRPTNSFEGAGEAAKVPEVMLNTHVGVALIAVEGTPAKLMIFNVSV